MRRHLMWLISLVTVVCVAGCSTNATESQSAVPPQQRESAPPATRPPKPVTAPPDSSQKRPESPGTSVPATSERQRAKLPELVSVSYGEESRDGSVYVLPIPVRLKATVRNARSLQWNIGSYSGDIVRYLVPEQVHPDQFEVEWGHPYEPPPRPVDLILYAEVLPEVPDSPTFVMFGQRRMVELVRVKVRSHAAR